MPHSSKKASEPAPALEPTGAESRVGLAAEAVQETALEQLERRLGYSFRDRKLLAQALVHGSAAAEDDLASNQRMEFLGDAVLDLAVSELIMQRHPDRSEGDLTRMRAALVNTRGLARVARGMDVGQWLKLGRGEEKSGGRTKPSILADTYEAVIGAVFLDGGYAAARPIVATHFTELIENAQTVGVDHKTDLQELTQKLYRTTPSYSVVAVTGPDHARHYHVEISLAGNVLAQGDGPNRKAAEQRAALAAVERLASKARE